MRPSPILEDQLRSNSCTTAPIRAAPTTTAARKVSWEVSLEGRASSMMLRNSSGGTRARAAPAAIMATKPMSWAR